MPKPSAMTGSFAVTDPQAEVVCPLKNHDGTACRKRCLGEKRFRSMQEHIRRAHPDWYIPKLPATEESIALMINTPLSERPPPPDPPQSHQQQQQQQHSNTLHHAQVVGPPGQYCSPQSVFHAMLTEEGGHGLDTPSSAFYRDSYTYDPRPSDDFVRRGSLLPASSAAEVLAQLHDSRQPEIHWDAEPDMFADSDAFRPRDRFGPIEPELAFNTSNDYYPSLGSRPKSELLPSSLAHSPPYNHSRPSTSGRHSLGKLNSTRPRKLSVSQNARKPKHERTKSRDHVRRSWDERNLLKSGSVEPGGGLSLGKLGSRWEDLIEAAASATEEDSRDLTPMPPSPKVPYSSTSSAMNNNLITSSSRNSLPPLLGHPHSSTSHHASSFAGLMHTYTASPLQNTLTPPPPDLGSDLHPFPSVESSADSSLGGHSHSKTTSSATSGINFHIPPSGLDASPTYGGHGGLSHTVQIYCAGCRRLTDLRQALACTECVCGLCRDCVDALLAEQMRGRGARCPKCGGEGGRFRGFQLDLR